MKTLFLLATIIFSQSTFASGNHYHPKQILKCSGDCSEAQIKEVVPTALDVLVKAKEVKDSWVKIPVEKIEKKQFSKSQEWVITFFDGSQKDSSKQRLYVFISLDGWLNGANNSGN
jgi:hypothetical protein